MHSLKPNILKHSSKDKTAVIKTVLLFLLFFATSARSQSDSVIHYQAPQFKGGYKALFGYIDNYITYPMEQLIYGRQAGLSAVIYISKLGKVKFVNVLGGNKDFRQEIKRLMTLMPDWDAGCVNGNPVDTFVIQRFAFSQDVTRFWNDTITYELNVYHQYFTAEELEKYQIHRNKEELQEKIWRPLYKKGVRETIKGNYELAIEFYKQSEKKGNRTALLYYDMSVAYYNLGDDSNNCDCLRKAALRRYEPAFKEYLKSCK